MGFEDEARDSVGVGLKVMLGSAFAFLAIVFAVVLFIMIVFHIHARSCRGHERRGRRELVFQIRTQIALVDVSFVESPSSGLDPVILASLPKLLHKNSEQFSQGTVTVCSVCLETIVEDATVRVLPNCKHMFHLDCIDKWFGSNTTCPICRTVVQKGHGHMGTQVQPTAPEVEDCLLIDAHELERVGGSGISKLRIPSSFQVMISGERSTVEFEDLETH